MYKLYVIPGSHACRSGILMVEHARVPYRRIDVLTLTHPVRVRLHGFDAGGETRHTGRRRTFAIRFGDTLGTVPALDADGTKVSTNRGIARFLHEHHPGTPFFPADAEKRRAVEEAEAWANGPLQMTARRLALAWAINDPAESARRGQDGRMGHLLYRSELARRVVIPQIGRRLFASGGAAERELWAELPAMLDRIDGWIDAGTVNGRELNAADFMIAPSLALLLYWPERMLPLLDGRPALELVDRLLPEPA